MYYSMASQEHLCQSSSKGHLRCLKSPPPLARTLYLSTQVFSDIIVNNDFCHSLWTVAPTNFISVCVYVCVCLCVCPAFTAYILVTMGRILIKLAENVGTSVRLIVLKFHKNRHSYF